MSRFKYSSVFSCCGTGMDISAIIEIEKKEDIKYRSDKPVVLEGKLKLNPNDPYRLIYILEDAICLDCKSRK